MLTVITPAINILLPSMLCITIHLSDRVGANGLKLQNERAFIKEVFRNYILPSGMPLKQVFVATFIQFETFVIKYIFPTEKKGSNNINS